jgi:hypothetical protein
MGRAVALMAVLLIPAELVAAEPPAPAPTPAASAVPAASPPPAGPRRRIKLEPWIDPYGKVPLPGIDMPRFDQRVDVPGKAMDSATLTARMNWFLGKDWDPVRGAVPRGSSAPSVEESMAFRPHPPPSANIGAALQWLAGVLGNKR